MGKSLGKHLLMNQWEVHLPVKNIHLLFYHNGQRFGSSMETVWGKSILCSTVTVTLCANQNPKGMTGHIFCGPIFTQP